MDEEAQQKFESELFWCIQKLQNSLTSGKLNKKQSEDVSKTLKTLQSSKAPLVKKRQVMSTQFGNYRAKMEEEENKSKKINKNIKFKEITPNKKSLFVRKHVKSESSNKKCVEEGGETIQSDVKFERSDNSFRFNF